MAVYTHTAVADRTKALEVAPNPKDSSDQEQAAKATGTRGKPPATIGLSPPNDKQNDNHTAESLQVTTPRRTRTYDPLIKSTM